MALNPVLGKLVSKRVVLASASPRRQEILTNLVSAGGPLAPPGQGRRPAVRPLRPPQPEALRAEQAPGAGRGRMTRGRACGARRLSPVSSRRPVAQGRHKPEPCLLQQLRLLCLGAMAVAAAEPPERARALLPARAAACGAVAVRTARPAGDGRVSGP